MKRRASLFLTALWLGAVPAVAQEGRRAITVADFDQWRSVHGATLSRDGRWAVYTLVPQVGDGEVVVRSTSGGAEHRHTRGYVGRPQTRAGATGPDAGYQPSRASSRPMGASPSSRSKPALRVGPRPPRAPQAGGHAPLVAGDHEPADGRVTVVPRVRSFRMPEENGRWLAYLLETDSTAARTARDTAAAVAAAAPGAAPAAAATPGGTPRPVSTDTARGGKKKDFGSTLVVRDLQTGNETRIEEVMAFAFDRGGRWLGYTVSARAGERDGAYVRALAEGRTHTLLAGAGGYRGLTFSDDGRQAAFTADRDSRDRDKPLSALYHAALGGGEPRARRVVDADQVGGGRMVAERGRIRFTEDGGAVVFGVIPVTPDSIPADSLADKAVFDLWNYRDARLQPQQRVEAARDRDSAWTAIVRPGERPVVIGSDTLRGVQLSDDGRTAVASDELSYAVQAMWGEGGADVYAIDTRTGTRRRVATRIPFDPQISPAAATSSSSTATAAGTPSTSRPAHHRTSRGGWACASTRRRGTPPPIPRPGASPGGRRATARCSSTTASTCGSWTPPAAAPPAW
jgi:hypothetical protein